MRIILSNSLQNLIIILLVHKLIWEQISLKYILSFLFGNMVCFSIYLNTLLPPSKFCGFSLFVFVLTQGQPISCQSDLQLFYVFGLSFPEVTGVFLFLYPVFQMVTFCSLGRVHFVYSFCTQRCTYLKYYHSKWVSVHFPCSSLIHPPHPRKQVFLVQKKHISPHFQSLYFFSMFHIFIMLNNVFC